ncbi:hypothetical protein SAMN05421504_108252 [Amycolatopsis xylanica]|uniref:Uncharacterized protein n=1 Tax=Amycolatopsis xylanica TaxID=589385 RepID=A0A1H3PJP3_9PSEU|nr:hypothetical protein SAMN05421504_108252 [Amycolatopsis xylanica]
MAEEKVNPETAANTEIEDADLDGLAGGLERI